MQIKTEWDLSFLYNGAKDSTIKTDTEKAERVIGNFVHKRKNSTEYLRNPEIIRQALDEYEQIQADYYHGTREATYRGLQTYLTQDEGVKANANKTALRDQQLFVQLDFFELNIAKIDAETQKKFLKSEALTPYHYFLQRLFDTAQYNLSEAEEKIITLMSKTSYSNREKMVEDFFADEQVRRQDDQGGKSNKGFEEIMTLLADSNKTIRDKAARIMNKRCKKNNNIAEKEINSILEYKYTIDQLRGYQRPDQGRHIADDVTYQMVDTIITVTQRNNTLAHRLYKLKAQLLGQKKLAYHERNVPITLQGKEKTYKFDEAVSIVDNVLGKLDPAFQEIFHNMVKDGKIDVYPQKGKRGGAFHAGLGKNIPGLVFLNFTNKLNDIATLAHELGHAIHTEFVRKNQHSLYYGYGMFMAEVASTFVEDFVYQEIEKELDEQGKLSLLIQRINDFVSSCMRQISCYTFETELHQERRKSGYLKKDAIGNIFSKHMSAYMGPYVTQSPGSKNRRTYRSHIRNFFYVYSYAGGILIAKAFQKKYKSDPAFIQNYKSIFLSAGKSEPPAYTLNKMGIDLQDEKFRQAGFEEVNEMMTQAENIAKKLSLL